MASLAPVVVSTYTRLGHLMRTVEALLANDLASKTSVTFLSDGPRKGDEAAVDKVRDYLSQVSGFGELIVIQRDTNDRVANNRGGMASLLAERGKMIFLEEDIVTAPGFIRYMNEALEFYENKPEVISISGYCPPIDIPSHLTCDNFFMKRFSAWGFATWASKFDPFGFEVDKAEARTLLASKKRLQDFCSRGPDLEGMLKSEVSGEIDALDVKVMFSNFKNNTYCSYPVCSFVQNAGFDGSGMHCGKSNRFDHLSLNTKRSGFEFEQEVFEDPAVLRANFRFRTTSIKQKAKQAFLGLLKN